MKVKHFLILISLIGLNLLTVSLYRAKIHQLEQTNQNLTTVNDSITVKYSRLTYQTTFTKPVQVVTNRKELKKLSQNLYNATTSNTAVSIQTAATASTPPQTITNTLTDSITSRFVYSYADSSFTQHLTGINQFSIINGQVNRVTTTIDTNRTSLRLTYNLTERNNRYYLQTSTSSPVIKLDELSSVFIIDKLPRKKNNPWSVGLFSGYGINTNSVGENLRTGWSFGIGITYIIL